MVEGRLRSSSPPGLLYSCQILDKSLSLSVPQNPLKYTYKHTNKLKTENYNDLWQGCNEKEIDDLENQTCGKNEQGGSQSTQRGSLARHSISTLEMAALKTEVFRLLWWQNWTSCDKTIYSLDLYQLRGIVTLFVEEIRTALSYWVLPQISLELFAN